MGKKIAIYTLCKNEKKNIVSWLENVRDADVVFVGDTGSTDNNVELLEKSGVHVTHVDIPPWRFDHARNQLLESISTDIDICVSLDFDERLCLGWRKLIKEAWQEDTTKLEYRYT